MSYLYWNLLIRKVSLHMKRINNPSPEHPRNTQRLNWFSLNRPVDLWDHKTSHFLKSAWKAPLKEHFPFLISAAGDPPGSLLKLPIGHNVGVHLTGHLLDSSLCWHVAQNKRKSVQDVKLTGIGTRGRTAGTTGPRSRGPTRKT